MARRLRTLGIVIATFGLFTLVAAGVAYFKVQDGYGSLQAFSQAQDVTLSYNDAGQLVDRGTVEGAQGIMSLLTDDWKYPVVQSDFDPNDPLVNSASEYMYQMATITYHTLHGSVQVTLPEDVEYNGEVFAAGTYDVPTEGRYWTGFDRMHPLEGPARDLVWTGTASALIAELGVGTVTATMLQMGVALAAAFGVMGFLGLIIGLGVIWVSRGDAFSVPDTIASIKEEKAEPAIA